MALLHRVGRPVMSGRRLEVYGITSSVRPGTRGRTTVSEAHARKMATVVCAVVLFVILSLVPGELSAQSYTFTHFVGNPGGAGFEDGTGSAARFRDPRGVAVDASGNLYVADRENTTVRKVSPSGAVTTLAGRAGVGGSTDGRLGAARLAGPWGIAIDPSGNVYFSDEYTIRRVSPTGLVTTIAGNYPVTGGSDGVGSAASFYYPEGVALDSSNNLYIADTFNHTIRKMTPGGTVSTFAGLAGSSGSADGTSAARFSYPEGVAVDPSGNVYVADSGNYTIRKITPAGVVSTFAGLAGAFGSADGNGTSARFNGANGVAVDGSGNIYVADGYSIRKITAGGSVSTLAGSGFQGFSDGTGTAASFNYPQGIAADASGNVYLAESFSHTVRKVTPAAVVTTVAGLAGTFGSSDGLGAAATFNLPSDIASDGQGNLYVTELNNHDVRKITPAGAVTFLAGGYGSADGTGSGARFSSPDGLVIDGTGNVYVADTSNQTIRKITPSGASSTIAGLAATPGSTDATGGAARFNYPSDVARDSSGNLYVTDRNNYTIRKITTGGAVSTLAGLTGASGSADGTGSVARFTNLNAITIDSADNIFIADGTTIRKMTTSGAVTTFAGQQDTQGNDDGLGTAARFVLPNGLATDTAGNLYVAESFGLIRKITPGGNVTTLGGSPICCDNGFNTDGTGAAAHLAEPTGIAIDVSGTLYITSEGGDSIRIGKPAISDVATIDAPLGLVGVSRQLSTSSPTATSWQWSIVRRPTGSAANLSSSSIRNPTFTPDIGDLFVFRLIATSASGSSITLVSLQASTSPVITAASALSRTAGSTGALSTIATVSDAEDLAGNLSVSVSSVPSGITFSSFTNTNGTITAFFSASCGAATGANVITLQVQDSDGLTSTSNLTVNVAADPPPTLGTYANTTINQLQSTGVTPTAPPGDETSLGSVTTSASGGFSGNLSVDFNTGVVSISNPNPGTFTISVFATDNCGVTTTRTFTLTVNAIVCPVTPISCPGSVDAALTASSCPSGQRGSSYYTDVYSFNGKAGTTVTIDETAAFDTYLYLLAPNGSVAAFNDDFNGLNSRIVFTLTTDGVWTIQPTTFSPGTTGAYHLALSGCGCTATPISVPGSMNGTLNGSSCISTPRGPGYYGDAYTFAGGRQVTIDVSSATAFDPYLYLVDPTNAVVTATGSQSARINKGLGYSGQYTLYVTTAASGATGAYQLRIRSCGTSLAPQDLAITYGGTRSGCNPGAACGASENIRFRLQQRSTGFFCETAKYSWDFGDGSSAFGGYEITHSYATPGTYNATVTVTDGPESGSAAISVIVAATTPASSHTFAHLAGSVGGTGSDDGTGNEARFENPFGIFVDAASNIYVAELGTTLRKLTPSGSVSTLAGQPGVVASTDGAAASAAFGGPRGVVGDGSGNLYVADAENHTIRKIAANGIVSTFAGSPGQPGSADGSGTSARFLQPRGLAIDGAGNLYVGDSYNHTIRKITSAGVVTTIAGSPGDLGSADGPLSVARFNLPYCIAVDSGNNLYVTEVGNNTIRKITPGGAVTTLAGLALATGSVDATGSNARFSSPKGVVVDASGNVYVADTGNAVIRRISPAGVVSTLAGTAGLIGSTDAVGSAARFNFPQGIAMDATGNLYVADSANNSIRKVTPGGVVTTIAGLGVAFGNTDGAGSIARFNLKQDFFSAGGHLATDSSANVYVTDVYNHTVRKISPAGAVSTLAGLAGSSGTADGTGTAARFKNPVGIATDGAGNVYVADTGNHTIRKITPGGVVTTLAGQAGTPGYTDATGPTAQFSSPYELTSDAAGNLYVADTNNRAIRAVTPGGAVTTLAVNFGYPRGITRDSSGNLYVSDGVVIFKVSSSGVVTPFAGQSGGSRDGLGGAASFSAAYGLASDAAGNIYAASWDSYTIRRITPAGVVTTLAGQPGRPGSADGSGGSARFLSPEGVATDSAGNIYVSDAGNHNIRVGRPTLPDLATINSPTGAIGLPAQLDTSPQNAASWQWKLIRRPAGSSANLTSETIRNPQFTPDVKDLYVFRLTASDGTRVSVSTVSLSVANTRPSIASGPSVNRTAGTAVNSPVSIAIVSDAEDAAGSLNVGYGTLPVGITIGTISNAAGSLSATVNAGCTAAVGSTPIVLTVTDASGATNQATFTVIVAANTPPSLGTYADTTINASGSTTIPPSIAPSDNGTVSLSVASVPAFTAGSTLSVNSSSGVVSVGTAKAGTYTISVTAADDCNLNTVRTFTLTVVPPFGTPTNLIATFVAPDRIRLTWNAVQDATGYQIARNGQPTEVLAGRSPFDDFSISLNAAYLYSVRAIKSVGGVIQDISPDSNQDLATTVVFTDPTITPLGTPIREVHMNELRTAVSAVRTLASRTAYPFTDTPVRGGPIYFLHFSQLRTALNEARTALGLSPLPGNPSSAGTPIRAADLTEIRNGVQ